MHKWTEEQLLFMREYVPGHSRKEIQTAVNERFGLDLSLSQVVSFMKRNHLYTGHTGYFPKGHVPWSKGKKMSPEQYEKCRATMFRNGSLPHNTDPIGTEKVLSDGYWWVKVDDQPKAKKNVNWKQKHRALWEEAHGPVPEGFLVTFLDGDRDHIELDNLALVNLSENGILNTGGLRFADPELTEVGINIARVTSKIAEKEKEKMRRMKHES